MLINKTRLLLFCSLGLFSQLIFSQNVVRSSGTAQVELTENQSRLEVKNKVRELATIDALEKAFGRVIIQGNSTYISNLQTGKEVQTNTVFNTIANTCVKGEVQRVISENFKDVEGMKDVAGKKEKVLDIRCDIEIMAREIVTPPVNFTAFPLGCLDEKCRSTKFKNNDRFYLFFSSPMSGYLTVYLDDKSESQCLYPHIYMKSGNEGGVPVEADKKYLLFSDVDYYLFTKSLQDMNRMFVIFSKTPLNKPSMNNDTGKDDNGFIFPKSLSSENFQRWLNSFRSVSRDNVQVEIIDITITK
jgi:hypothetical protein